MAAPPSKRRNGFVRETIVVLLGALLVSLLGVGLGRTVEFLHLATLAYLGWHLFQLRRLWIWLQHPKTPTPPEFSGIWREISEAINKKLRSNHVRIVRKRKPKLNWVVKRFNKSISALPDATVLLDQESEIEWWNTAAGQLLGLRENNDRGKQITHLIRYPEFTHRLQKERIWQQPLEVPSPVDPNTWLAILVVPAGKSKRLLQARDTTRLHRLERIRRNFVANASHELRTPLTVINGYVETLLDRQDAKTLPWYPVLPKIHQQAERMGKIIENLLLLSRLELGQNQTEREHVSVATMLKHLGEEARAFSGEAHHDIEIEIQSQARILGNWRELHSAFSNLIFNAVRYTAPDGKITVRWYQDHQGGHLLVQDTGIGIDAQDIPRITERFYRVNTGRSRETDGTGLGLTIVKHVLIQHKAELSIESTLGKGSNFICHFPPSRISRPIDQDIEPDVMP